MNFTYDERGDPISFEYDDGVFTTWRQFMEYLVTKHKQDHSAACGEYKEVCDVFDRELEKATGHKEGKWLRMEVSDAV